METLHEYLTEQAALCRERARALQADDRCDEAIFEKVRGNVFDIFRTVRETAEKQPQPEAFFLARLRDIPANWEAALEKAKVHGDENRAHTESVKLDAVRAIREKLGVGE